MKLGIQYFRDPTAPEEYWEKDCADIAAAGFAYIGCWIPWRYVSPAEDQWELDRYLRLLALAEKNGLKVRIQLVPESAPDWAVRKFPDSLLINEHGQTVPLHPHPMLQLGGWPGLNPNHPEARKLIDGYFTAVVRRLKKSPAILTWNIWNEIQVPLYSYDPFTREAYRAWMKNRYSSIAGYNRVHATQCEDFSEICLPNPAVESPLILQRAGELEEFMHAAVKEEAARRAGLIRQEDPVRPVSMHTNCNSPFDPVKDSWATGDAVDIVGNSLYANDPFYDTMSCIHQKSVKGPEKWWMVEHAGGRFVYYYGHYTYSGENLASDIIRTLAYGAGAAFLWQYRNEICGQEAPNFGVINQDGSRSERYDTLARLAEKLKGWDASVLRYPEPETALLVEPMDFIFRKASDVWMQQPWQEYAECERWLEALLYAGRNPLFLPARRLAATSIPSSVKVLFIPSLVVLRDGVGEVLRDWVHAGGHLVAGPFTGVFRTDGRTFPRFPGGCLRKVFGLHVEDRISGERFPLSSPGKTGDLLTGAHLLEKVRPERGTDVLLRYGKLPAVLSRQTGKGTATYIATFLGPMNRGYRSPLSVRLKSFLRDTAGILPAMEVTGSAWFTTATRGDRRVLFLQNPDKEKKSRAVVGTGKQTLFEDVVSGEVFSGKTSVAIPLGPRQVRMLVERKAS